ncbi:hypothetical protein PPL_06849 [Heterostelium album PN500]|uniref:Uncharacterized protein n=1 Tax=Heterostelium pallidum (strain ATCC 26659 / Pp 5 / PN500) TaxID=670386 RepID=D3BDP7_HETP5|nr:hypothetical protein PPL_06849 [Heterostelium album PN500]EFA80028.1 hypothetical protein PPL_06849 [Heterostelium album PN500]|eukprot:XP_020432148.1 hypothetical protein PPL_06849 [Heterostelium album PN500]
MSYLANAYLLSRLKHLSIDQCITINFINGLFKGCLPPTITPTTTTTTTITANEYTEEQLPPPQQEEQIPEIPKLLSLKLPTLRSNTNTIMILRYLSSITSLSLPGSIESFMFLRFLESCPSLNYLSLSGRYKDNLFHKTIVDKLCTYKNMKELHLYSLSKMTGEDIGAIAMNLIHLERLSITNNQWLTSDIVNLIFESCQNLKSLDISHCREVSNISASSSNLLSLDLSNTDGGDSTDVYFPNLLSLSLKSWNLDLPMINKIFSRNLSSTLINDEQLLPILINCSSLNILILERSNITPISIENINQYSKHLTKLILTSNSNITKTDLQPLFALGTIDIVKFF